MSLLQSYRNLSPRMRLGVGVGLIAWSLIGLQVSDRAEERLGLKPSEEDEAAFRKYIPRVVTVDRDGDSKDR